MSCCERRVCDWGCLRNYFWLQNWGLCAYWRLRAIWFNGATALLAWYGLCRFAYVLLMTISSAVWLNLSLNSMNLDWTSTTCTSLIVSRLNLLLLDAWALRCTRGWGPRSFEIEHIANIATEFSYSLNTLLRDVQSFSRWVFWIDIWQNNVWVLWSSLRSILLEDSRSRHDDLWLLYTLWNCVLVPNLNLLFWIETTVWTTVRVACWSVLVANEKSSE